MRGGHSFDKQQQYCSTRDVSDGRDNVVAFARGVLQMDAMGGSLMQSAPGASRDWRKGGDLQEQQRASALVAKGGKTYLVNVNAASDLARWRKQQQTRCGGSINKSRDGRLRFALQRSLCFVGKVKGCRLCGDPSALRPIWPASTPLPLLKHLSVGDLQICAIFGTAFPQLPRSFLPFSNARSAICPSAVLSRWMCGFSGSCRQARSSRRRCSTVLG